MVHGRNSYKRSAALGQFVMHRGMIISTMQVNKSWTIVMMLLVYILHVQEYTHWCKNLV